MTDKWQVSAARDHFSKIIDAVLNERPQFIRRRDGREVVVVSMEYFRRTKPSLRDLLLFGGFIPEGDDDLDISLAEARGFLGAGAHRGSSMEDLSDEDHRHGHRERLPETEA